MQNEDDFFDEMLNLAVGRPANKHGPVVGVAVRGGLQLWSCLVAQLELHLNVLHCLRLLRWVIVMKPKGKQKREEHKNKRPLIKDIEIYDMIMRRGTQIRRRRQKEDESYVYVMFAVGKRDVLFCLSFSPS